MWRREKGHALRPFEDVIEVIEKRGGKFVDFIGEYKGIKTKIKVRCAEGHKWTVTVSSLLHANSWCPTCLNTIGEQITRSIFQATYGFPFPKVRPGFLVSNKGGHLELDGYNENNCIAFEYQGPHHKNPAQIERDNIKKKICSERGITLISISYVKNPLPPNKVLQVVETEIRKIDPNKKVILPKVDFTSSKLRKLREIAYSRGGKLLSESYMGGGYKLLWKCKNTEHPPWKAIPNNIMRDSWCPHCAKNVKIGIEGLKAFGKSVGLNLISIEYHGANELYDWQCKFGHIIKRSKPNIKQSVKNGLNACTVCAGTFKDVTIEHLIQTATDRKGKCLTKKYINEFAYVRWKCAYGHIFNRNWNKVQQGYWCTFQGCPDKRRFNKIESKYKE